MKCPTCNKPATWQDNPFRPFCSERCKLIDFGKWANEEYTIPSHPSAPADDLENIHPAPETDKEL
jgi:endogenous inhibitor of DNA gyrase (YacG/DUF329 family)